MLEDMHLYILKAQKQPSRGVLRKRCSENMQQIYIRTLMPKHAEHSCKAFIEIILWHGCSAVNWLHMPLETYMVVLQIYLIGIFHFGFLTETKISSRYAGRKFV